MEPQNYHTWVLITRVLSNEADASEKEELQQWMDEDYSHRKFFEELEASWKEEPHKDGADAAFLFDKEEGLNKLRSKIQQQKEEKTKILDKNNKILFKRNRNVSAWRWAASILLLVAAASVWAAIHFWQPAITNYTTNAMEQQIITLPDGSKVRLNKNSRISFAEGFAGSIRKINLTGEAFFNVHHDADKPFIIHIGDAIIQDIGTSFNVKKEKNGKIVVAMKSGVALFKNINDEEAKGEILKKGQVGVLNSKGQLATIKRTSVHNYLSWINGQLSFKETSFGKVTSQLENIYGIHCQLADSSLSALKLTAYTNKTSLSEVLHMIALSLDIRYKTEGGKVIWMKSAEQGRP